jgi:SAM-dependent methyltransferase
MSDEQTTPTGPSAHTFGELYEQLGASATYQRMMAEVFGEGYAAQLSIAAPADVRMLATRAGVKPGMRVADLCCGLGGPSLLIAKEFGCTVVAVDWSRQAVASCRRSAETAGLGAALRCVTADVGQAPFADGAFDAVISIDGFYFGVDLPALYADVFRMLRPGGSFAFYFDVPSQEVVDASPPDRRAHRESHRIDHPAALTAAGFVDAWSEDRTGAQQLLFERMADTYSHHYPALEAEIGPELAADLRDEVVETLHMTANGLWPRYLFSARKPLTP